MSGIVVGNERPARVSRGLEGGGVMTETKRERSILERPILMCGEMVRAVLSGNKTQTRRVVKPQPLHPIKACTNGFYVKNPNASSSGNDVFAGPYGVSGDRLWVRENYTTDHEAFYPHYPVIYQADGYDPRRECKLKNGKVFSPETKTWHQFRWRPSIHMPRARSRINLEIVSVGVERVQDINEADAQAEGVQWPSAGDHGRSHPTCVDAFKSMWDSINRARGFGWDANPWVWVVKFQRVEVTP